MHPSTPEEDLALLRAENADLRSKLEEADQLLQAAAVSEEGWLERQKEYEALLEEKSEVIRVLHHKLQTAQSAAADSEVDATPAARSPQFEQERRELEEMRQQLEQDEESLMAQMRQMELAMSRDRAELARQRNEIQRMHADLQHELEIASRDAALNDRLANLRRRHQEVVAPKTAAPSPGTNTPPSDPKKGSGLLRRLFGGNQA